MNAKDIKQIAKVEKVRAGLYNYTDIWGRLWIVEYRMKADGYSRNEWWVGPENDPGCDQTFTKSAALEGLKAVLENDAAHICPNCNEYPLQICQMTWRYMRCGKCGHSQPIIKESATLEGTPEDHAQYEKRLEEKHGIKVGDTVDCTNDINKSGIVIEVRANRLTCEEWVVDELKSGYEFEPTGEIVTYYADDVHKAKPHKTKKHKFDVGDKVHLKGHNSETLRGEIVMVYGSPKRYIVKWHALDEYSLKWHADGEQSHAESELLAG